MSGYRSVREKKSTLYSLSFKSTYPILISYMWDYLILSWRNYPGEGDSEFSDSNEIFLFWWNSFYFLFLSDFWVL